MEEHPQLRKALEQPPLKRIKVRIIINLIFKLHRRHNNVLGKQKNFCDKTN